MKKIFLVLSCFIIATQVYAGNGDLTVNGSLGVGTTNPTTKFQVNGSHVGTEIFLHSSGDGGTGDANLYLWASEPGSTYQGVGISNNVKNYDGTGVFRIANNVRGGSFIRLLDNAMLFSTVDSSSNRINTMYLQGGTGNVGIGTTSPIGKLHIAGAFSGGIMADGYDRPSVGISGNYPQLELMAGGTGNTSHGPTITLGSYDSGTSGNLKHWSIGTSGQDSTFLDIGYAANDLNPHAGIRNYNGTTIMTLTNAGNVGIGTTNPGEKLEVAGNVYISGSYLRFPHAFGDANDGKIGNSMFAQGLNLVGINNDNTARKIQLWGSIIQNQNDLGNTWTGTNTFTGDINTRNINFQISNPTLSASSYMVIPGGAYFNSGTVYAEAPIQARGGVHNDTGSYLMLNGGSSGKTKLAGNLVFPDGTEQSTAATSGVISSGTAYPGTNTFDIAIPATTGAVKLIYSMTSSTDAEPVLIGFNDNTTAVGTYGLYATGTYGAIAGKVHAGYARTTTGSAGSMNSFDIRPNGNLIFVNGEHVSEANFQYWAPIFVSYLKYGSPQTITKINIRCYHAGTTISQIDWKLISIP